MCRLRCGQSGKNCLNSPKRLGNAEDIVSNEAPTGSRWSTQLVRDHKPFVRRRRHDWQKESRSRRGVRGELPRPGPALGEERSQLTNLGGAGCLTRSSSRLMRSPGWRPRFSVQKERWPEGARIGSVAAADLDPCPSTPRRGGGPLHHQHGSLGPDVVASLHGDTVPRNDPRIIILCPCAASGVR
jgi:hypothetical protein